MRSPRVESCESGPAADRAPRYRPAGPMSWTGPRGARCPCRGSIAARPAWVCVLAPTAQEWGVDEERLVRASLCPAAGFGLVDASARLPLAGCDEGPAPR